MTQNLADRLSAAVTDLITEAIDTEIIDPAQLQGVPDLTIAKLLFQSGLNLIGGKMADFRPLFNELNFTPEPENDEVEGL